MGLPPEEDSQWEDAWNADPEAKTAVEVDPGGPFGRDLLVVAQTRALVHPTIAALAYVAELVQSVVGGPAL